MIEITLFKFDSKTDYLPYYKTYTLEKESVTTLNDVLQQIYTIEKFDYLPNETFFLRANNNYTDSNALVTDCLNECDEILLEPLSVKRALNDFVIDTKDYQEKLNLLDAYMSESEKTLIIENKTYMLEYYASNTLYFNEDYIGEHVILLALDIVKKDPSLQDEIFKLLDCEDGVINKSSLKYRILNYPTQLPLTQTSSLEVIQSFENFNIALYCALEIPSFKNTIIQSDATYIDLKSKHFDIPTNSKQLSYLMAGHILLEALDNNADFLIVNDRNDIALFDAKQKNIEKTMGREIGLPILTQAQFMQLIQGEKNQKNLACNTHKIKLNFLD